MTDHPPVLRRECRWCGSSKQAIQYAVDPSTNPTGAGVCLVCPRCDSPSDADES